MLIFYPLTSIKMKNTTHTTPATKECENCSRQSTTDPCEFCGHGIDCERCKSRMDEHTEGYLKWSLCRDCESEMLDQYPDLLKLAELFSETCATRLSLLRDDLKEGLGDPEDINDMIGHWTAMKTECDAVIARANGKAS